MKKKKDDGVGVVESWGVDRIRRRRFWREGWEERMRGRRRVVLESASRSRRWMSMLDAHGVESGVEQASVAASLASVFVEEVVQDAAKSIDDDVGAVAQGLLAGV